MTRMHTFSPAKMWIHGTRAQKPLLHFPPIQQRKFHGKQWIWTLYRQTSRHLGDREFEHIVIVCVKIGKSGCWALARYEKAQAKLRVWMRVSAGWADAQDMHYTLWRPNE